MKASHHMVLISLSASLIVLSLLVFYKFIFPKKTPHPLFFVLLVSLLPAISIFREGSYESGDLFIHIVRTMSFYSSLSEGIAFPHWAKDLNATFGYPIHMFDAPLQYYVSSIFHYLGFSFLTSVKLTLTLAFVSAGIAMYLFAKELFGKMGGVVSAIFYIFAPYHLVDTHFRVSIGEVSFFTFIPLTMLTLHKFLIYKSYKWFVLNSVSTALMVLSSPTSIIGFTFIGFYVFFLATTTKKIKDLILLGLSFFTGLLLSAFYWLPVILEGKFTHHAEFHSQVLYQSLSAILYKSYRFGLLFQGHKGELTALVGYIQLVVVVIAIIFLLKRKFNKKEGGLIKFLLVSLLTTIFLMTAYSSAIWDLFPIYKNLQFSYRLLIIVCFLTSFIAGITLIKIKRIELIILICAIAIFSTILNWGNRRNIPSLNDAYFKEILPLSTYMGEGGDPALPKWTPHDTSANVYQKKVPKNHLEVLQGDAKVTQGVRTSTVHEYTVNAKSSAYLKENTLYFPGWVVKINGKTHPINYQNPKYPGIMTFNLDKGVSEVDITFKDTPIRKNSKLISLITFFSVLALFLINRLFRPR